MSSFDTQLEKNKLTPEQKITLFQKRVFRHVEIEPASLNTLASFIRRRQYARKTPLVMAGEQWDKLYLIESGLIRLFYSNVQGKEFNKAFFWEGHCIWPVAPRDRNQAALFNIATIEACTVVECPIRPIYNLLQKSGQWETFALPFAEKLLEQKFSREHALLLLSATERFDKLAANYPIDRIPDYHLASFLGITNVSLSRIRNRG